MILHRASLLAGAAAAAWLVQPAQAQEIDSEAIPDELRIIDDLPEAVEEGRRALGLGDDRGEPGLRDDARGGEDVLTDERAEEGRSLFDGRRDSLFGDDRSLLSAAPGDGPAERLLPDEDNIPDVELGHRARDPLRDDDARPGRDAGRAGDGNDLQGRITGPEDTVPEPPDAGGLGAGPAGGGTGGGSGSLF